MSKVITRSRWAGMYGEYVQDKFGNFKTKLIEQDEECFELTIFNPNVKERDITICFSGVEALFLFSYQYAYFDYNDGIDQLVAYANKFICEDYVAFQFFKHGKYAMCGCQKSREVDLSSIQSILKTFIPDLNANQVEKRALTLSEVLPNVSYDEHKKGLTVCPAEARKKHYDIFRTYEYKLGVEYWSGNNDMYKRIFWDGYDFRIIDIGPETLLEINK